MVRPKHELCCAYQADRRLQAWAVVNHGIIVQAPQIRGRRVLQTPRHSCHTQMGKDKSDAEE